MHKHKMYKFSHRTTNAIKLVKIGVGEKSEPKVIFLFSKSNNFQYDMCRQICTLCFTAGLFFKQKSKLAEKLKAAVASSL